MKLVKKYFSTEHMRNLAKFGCVEGLKVFKDLTRYQRSEMAIMAASKGQ